MSTCWLFCNFVYGENAEKERSKSIIFRRSFISLFIIFHSLSLFQWTLQQGVHITLFITTLLVSILIKTSHYLPFCVFQQCASFDDSASGGYWIGNGTSPCVLTLTVNWKNTVGVTTQWGKRVWVYRRIVYILLYFCVFCVLFSLNEFTPFMLRCFRFVGNRINNQCRSTWFIRCKAVF